MKAHDITARRHARNLAHARCAGAIALIERAQELAYDAAAYTLRQAMADLAKASDAFAELAAEADR